VSLDDTLLDDPEELVAIDSQRMLASTASAGAAIRAALAVDGDHALGPLTAQGRPRSLCVVGAGGSSAPGEVLAAVAGRGSPVPVFAFGGPSLPGWVGPMDLVVAVSASGRTPEILSFIGEAQRRGSSVLGVGAAGSPLLLLAGDLGLVANAREGLAAAAQRLDARAIECGLEVAAPENPAKSLTLHLTAGLPLVWGSGDIGAVAARRLGRQLAENADWPSVVGALPDAARTHAGLLAGPWAGQAGHGDIFRDRALDDEQPQPRMRAVLVRDAMEHPDTSAIADAVIQTCERLAVPYQVLSATAGHPIEQLADLIAVMDFASIYAALMQRRDPSFSAEDIDPRFGRIRPTEGG